MKIKRLLSFIISLFVVCGMSGCNNSNNNDKSTQTEETRELQSRPINNGKFADPDLCDLPMVQMHNPSTSLIDDVYNRGYGGVVMNVKWNNTYLNNTRDWTTFSGCVEHAIDKGMHVWIYDEYGYPSGSAFGQTLKNNPEYEALGLTASYEVVGKNATKTINLVHGSTAIVSAYVYDGTSSSSMDLSTGSDISTCISKDGTSVTYTNRTNSSKVLVAYMSKRWYENTHSMENWYCQQRYINMLEEGATKKFLSITHDKYYDNLSEYFGHGIEAFFTDEPALQGNYFNISSRNRTVLDTPDTTIPILECLNYSNTLFEKFKEKYGYELKDYLAYLYKEDNSTIAKQVRIDFYGLTSELFQSNYLGQTTKWCDSHNVKSSGHLLLEETLYQNPWFAGNMIQLLGTMGIPGTDLLYSTAARASLDSCITSKFASSAAEFTGKNRTFAEISGAFDATAGDMYSQLNAVGVQVAMGINTFSSYYYQGNDHTVAEDQIFSKAIGRMTYMTNGSDHKAKNLVYYPYEGVSAETLPTTNMWTCANGAKEVSESFTDVCRSMTGKQVDYDIVDYENLSKCTVKDGKLISPHGEEYQSIVIPYTTALMSKAVEKIVEAKNAGVKVILVGGIESVVCEKGSNKASEFNSIISSCKNVTSGVAAAKELKNNGYSYAKVSDNYAENLVMTMRENKEYKLFTVVNGYTTDKEYTFTLEGTGKKLEYYNTVTGEKTTITPTQDNGNSTFTFKLPANRTGFFVMTK